MSGSSEGYGESGGAEGAAVTTPSVELPGLRWRPAWVSHCGCLSAAADYLGVSVSVPWLYGVTGYAFLLNIHDELCPSGWHLLDVPLEEALPHAGLAVRRVALPRDPERDKEALKRRIWDGVRANLDGGMPCCAYNLEIGEYYTIHGYDEVGYYYSGPLCEVGKGPLPWEAYGDGSPDMPMAVHAVTAGEESDPVRAVRHALLLAVRYAREIDGASERYVCGPEGYDQWMDALEQGRASGWGTAYNACCYHECRANAIGFLTEARHRLEGAHDDLFDEAQVCYREVAECLARVTQLLPVFDDDVEEHVRERHKVNMVIEDLRLAKAAEERGLWALAALAEQLRA